MSIISKILRGDRFRAYWQMVEKINSKEKDLAGLSSEKLLGESAKLKKKTENTALDELLPDAFALVREASKRTLKQRHYDVQLIGGIVLHEGKIAEMLTGEGKTLVATLPAFLNALSGKGVHIVTVNDYLAKRDTVWMGQIYHALGLKVSCIAHNSSFIYDPDFESLDLDKERDETGSFKVIESFLRPVSRREAYGCDIVYGTNHEFGFDLLRDNLALNLKDKVQRDLNFVIIDEVDSILIDEARTPLIISAPDSESSEFYKIFARVVDRLEAGEDYVVDEKSRTVNVTESGINKVEEILKITNIFAPQNSRLVHFLHESLKAKALFKKDKDYVVKNGEIIIIDEFTGRMLFGRRYSGGLHQAIEAKENVRVKEESRTYATITIQNYFRLYQKISGMTGTAETSAEEFHKVYNIDVVNVPSNKPLVRKDMPDAVYKTKEAKYKAIIQEIISRHGKGQPVLVGTTSIINNEILSELLNKENIPHEILNAKNHEREAAIIAQAGKLGAITVATNMAGRGVDIVLGGNPYNKETADKIRSLGGLHVLGTERHEARRIDNQLRGRSGRQGDPGSTQFFLSLEDDLMRIFGGERIQKIMNALKVPDEIPIESGMVSKSVNQAQARVEGFNFDIRRHLLDFDDVLNRQRTALYAKRAEILQTGDENKIASVLENLTQKYEELDAEKKELIPEIKEKIKNLDSNEEKERSILIAQTLVRIIDTLWIDHLENLESLRESVSIRAYGQHEPLVEYRREAHLLYKELTVNYENLAVKSILPLLSLDLSKIHEMHSAPSEKPDSSDLKKIGRNDPCHCGAKKEDGTPKKYKHCHGKDL